MQDLSVFPVAFLNNQWPLWLTVTVYPKKYAHGFCFAVFCCGYTLTDFPISFRLTSLALWQSNDCPSASKATLMNMDKYFMWIHYERMHNHNKAKHNKTVCIFLGIYCRWIYVYYVHYHAAVEIGVNKGSYHIIHKEPNCARNQFDYISAYVYFVDHHSFYVNLANRK